MSKSKLIYGVGYIGEGRYKSHANGEKTQSYIKWFSMITRCYNKKQLKRRTNYEEVTVCDEWHNFQNFAAWYYDQDCDESSYCLDKDILIEGNMVYSPDACCLIPAQINTLLTVNRGTNRTLPLGAYLDKRYNRFRSKISANGRLVYLGMFATAQEAHEAYVFAKESHVRDKAVEYRDRISDKVFDALMSWRVGA